MKTITERARELFIASSAPAAAPEAIRVLGVALDEYQASVETRLTACLKAIERILMSPGMSVEDRIELMRAMRHVWDGEAAGAPEGSKG